jgi:DNA-binding MarR family transcriptional regulator
MMFDVMNAIVTTPGALVLLTRLARRVYRLANDGLLGMSLKEFILLNQLREEQGTPQRQLGDTMCLDPNNLVLLLNGVERQGWAERRRDAEDRRRHLVYLTPSGAAVLDAAERRMDGVEDDVLRNLTPEERATLRLLLDTALTDQRSLTSAH